MEIEINISVLYNLSCYKKKQFSAEIDFNIHVCKTITRYNALKKLGYTVLLLSVCQFIPWTFFVASFSGPTLHGYLKFDFRVEFIGLPYDTFTHYPTISYILNTYTPLDTWIANLKMFVIFFAETSIQGFLKFVSRFIIVSYITFLDSSINNFLLTKIFGCGYHQSADASSFTCCYLNYHTCWLI